MGGKIFIFLLTLYLACKRNLILKTYLCYWWNASGTGKRDRIR